MPLLETLDINIECWVITTCSSGTPLLARHYRQAAENFIRNSIHRICTLCVLCCG